jgi:hypothetical protein
MSDAHTLYVHDYQPREAERLQDQAATLADLLHNDTAYRGVFCYTLFKGVGQKERTT